jgi:hypothetical protein
MNVVQPLLVAISFSVPFSLSVTAIILSLASSYLNSNSFLKYLNAKDGSNVVPDLEMTRIAQLESCNQSSV